MALSPNLGREKVENHVTIRKHASGKTVFPVMAKYKGCGRTLWCQHLG